MSPSRPVEGRTGLVQPPGPKIMETKIVPSSPQQDINARLTAPDQHTAQSTAHATTTSSTTAPASPPDEKDRDRPPPEPVDVPAADHRRGRVHDSLRRNRVTHIRLIDPARVSPATNNNISRPEQKASAAFLLQEETCVAELGEDTTALVGQICDDGSGSRSLLLIKLGPMGFALLMVEGGSSGVVEGATIGAGSCSSMPIVVDELLNFLMEGDKSSECPNLVVEKTVSGRADLEENLVYLKSRLS